MRKPAYPFGQIPGGLISRPMNVDAGVATGHLRRALDTLQAAPIKQADGRTNSGPGTGSEKKGEDKDKNG